MKKVEAFSQEYYKIENETCVVDCANDETEISSYKIPEAVIVGAIGIENKTVEDCQLFIDRNSEDESESDLDTVIEVSNENELYSVRHNLCNYCSITIVTGLIIIFVVYFGKYRDKDDDSIRG